MLFLCIAVTSPSYSQNKSTFNKIFLFKPEMSGNYFLKIYDGEEHSVTDAPYFDIEVIDFFDKNSKGVDVELDGVDEIKIKSSKPMIKKGDQK